MDEPIASAPQVEPVKLEWRGEQLLFRPLRAGDGPCLADYFGTLSNETRYLYHPHPFTADSADQLCAEASHGETVRMVAISDRGAARSIIAYIILDFGLSEEDGRRYRGYGVELKHPICRIGPSVSNSLRGQGLGAILFGAVRDIAHRAGCEHIILLGGVFTINARAIRFYEKVGMRKMGTYGGENGPQSWDMMVDV